jgi:hypothetical protein
MRYKRMMRWLFILFIGFALGISPSYAQGRKARKDTERSMQEQAKAKAASEREFDEKYSMRKNQHLTAQDKATRKRMKANRKRAQRETSGQRVPFYKRWFRKKHFR